MCFRIEFQITTHADKLQDVKTDVTGTISSTDVYLPGTHPGPVQTRPVLCQVAQGLCQLICYSGSTVLLTNVPTSARR